MNCCKSGKSKAWGWSIPIFMALGGVAAADSIDPISYSDTLAVGESVSIRKTVTIDAGGPTSALVDIVFLADETGSMGGEIADVRNAASAILTATAGLGDVQWGVGGYRDFTDAFAYRELTDLTATQGDVQSAINTWAASGGGDFYEANLYALEQVATGIDWRAGSTRIVVWFGDAPGHDPSGGITEADAIAALSGENITVHALDAGFLDNTGQATRITAATGGTLGDLGTGTSAVTDSILAAIDATFATYSNVSLEVGAGADCVDVAIDPAGGHSGSYDRSVSRDFGFTVTFTGTTPGDCSFDINALVDGGIVATERDSFRVTAGGPAPVPVPASLPLLLGEFLGSGAFLRRRRK